MSSVGKIFVELGLNSNALTRGLASAGSQIRAFVASPFGGLALFEGMKLGIGGMVSGVRGVKSFMDQSAFAASDLNEQLSSTRVQLGSVADEAIKFAQGMQQAGQQTFGEALGGLTSVTTALMGQGIAADKAIDKAMELQQRFADLGSQRNMAPGLIQEKFQAMMRGEMDPVESLNVFTNVEKLRAAGKPLGLAAADEFLRQTASAAGDFKNTSLSLANLTRQNEVGRSGIMGQVGNALAPAYQAAAWFENQFLKRFSDSIMSKLGPAGDKLFSGVYSLGQTLLEWTPWIADKFIWLGNTIASTIQWVGSVIRSPGEYLKLALIQVATSMIDFAQKLVPSAFQATEGTLRENAARARAAIAEADKVAMSGQADLKAKLEAGSQGVAPAGLTPLATPMAGKAARTSSFGDYFKGIVAPGGAGKSEDTKRLESIDGSLKTIAATVTGNQAPGVKPIGWAGFGGL